MLQAQSKRPLQKMTTNSLWEFLRLFLPVVLLFLALVTLYSNVFQSQDERPLQKLATLSFAELIPVFSSGFVLCCDCHTLFKRAPSARWAPFQKCAANPLWGFAAHFFQWSPLFLRLSHSLMQAMGFEPTLQRNCRLKTARLPFRHACAMLLLYA